MPMRQPVIFAAFGVVFCGLVFGAVEEPGPASANPAETRFLEAFVGDWRGQGSLRRSPAHDAEAVVCRARAELNGPQRLEISGRCGGDGFTGTFRIIARYDPPSGGYAALFAGPPSIGSTELYGHREHDALRLTVSSAHYQASELLISRQSATRFRIRSETTTGQQSFVSTDIELRRQ